MRALGITLFLLFEDAVEFLGRSFDLALPADHKLADRPINFFRHAIRFAATSISGIHWEGRCMGYDVVGTNPGSCHNKDLT